MEHLSPGNKELPVFSFPDTCPPTHMGVLIAASRGSSLTPSSGLCLPLSLPLLVLLLVLLLLLLNLGAYNWHEMGPPSVAEFRRGKLGGFRRWCHLATWRAVLKRTRCQGEAEGPPGELRAPETHLTTVVCSLGVHVSLNSPREEIPSLSKVFVTSLSESHYLSFGGKFWMIP